MLQQRAPLWPAMGGRRLAAGLPLLLLLCSSCASGDRYIEDTDRFPGWKGALPLPGEKPAAEAALSQEAKGVTIAVGDSESVRHPSLTLFTGV